LLDPPKLTAIEDEEDEPTEPDLSIIDVNLCGVLYTSKLAMHYFSKQPISTDRDRCLIITASLAGYLDPDQAPLYQTSKFGVRGLMCNLRRTDRLRVNLIAPL
jgi:NAD(P)-dependent dehydrogenase (short-subunit alcohol dehydrogenase family)